MNLEGTFVFGGPRPKVWELLQDPVVLAKALPGTERLALASEDRFEGVMKVSVGPVTAAKFDVTVTLRDKVPPERFAMQIDGKGALGYTRGSATVELHEEAGDRTLMRYQSEIQVGGRIAAVGQRLLDSVSRMMMRQALEALETELKARLNEGDRRS
jgi:carbon monoxide dehydrogenase subunit G